MPLITLQDAELAFGLHPLLDRAGLVVDSGERIGLIGRNGTGKSSMLAIVAGAAELDAGTRKRQDGLVTHLVEQEPVLPPATTLRESLALRAGPALHVDDERERWRLEARLVEFLHRFGLDEAQDPASASGGQRKRAALALAFALAPDLLLLDEPTNHLDLDGIDLLEEFVRRQPACIVITHDRMFLDKVATRIVELDRGLLRSYPGNFAAYETRKADQLAAEAVGNRKFDTFWKQEEAWIRKGVEARRTRDEGRVRRLEALRRERAARRERSGNVAFTLQGAERSGKLVAELLDVTKGWGDNVVVRDLDLTVMRGDRIGIIGRNGAGKTTLLKLILGELAPDRGTVRLGTKLEVAYFDQMRAQLDPARTLAETISPGSEWIEAHGGRKHVLSYLARIPLPARARAGAGQHALRWRAQPPAARASLRAARQPARARRAHQRPRHRVARAARGHAAIVCRHAAAGEPRPHLPRQRRHADDRRRRRRPLEGIRRAATATGSRIARRAAHRRATREPAQRAEASARRAWPPSCRTRSSASSMRCRPSSRRSRRSRRRSMRA